MRDIKSIDFDVGGKFSRKNIKLIYIYIYIYIYKI